MDKSNVVYSIPCINCNKCYIGITKNKLNKRTKQHIYDCKSFKKESTALSKHHFDTGHNFAFDRVKILANEVNYKKRTILEMLYINRFKEKTVNFRTDTSHLSNIYSHLIK